MKRVLHGLVLALLIFARAGAAEPDALILVLGDDSYIPAEAVKDWTGAEVKKALGPYDLQEFSLVILTNIAYAVLPQAIHAQLPEFVSRGGSLLITGGPNAYGSGGYQALDPLIPCEIRAEADWVSVPFRPVIVLQPDHPILQGVTFRTIGAFNDLNPRTSGVVEIAQYAGGGPTHIGPLGEPLGARFPSPLIAERTVGKGTVLGVAFDLGQEIKTGWSDGSTFTRNTIIYLVDRSPFRPKPREDLSQIFSEWQESCEEKLRHASPAKDALKRAATACRRHMQDRHFPHIDLVDMWIAQRLVVVEQVVKGELSEHQGDQALRQLNMRIRREIEGR